MGHIFEYLVVSIVQERLEMISHRLVQLVYKFIGRCPLFLPF